MLTHPTLSAVPCRGAYLTWSLLLLLALVAAADAGMIGTGLSPQILATGDLNEDGFADLVSGNAGDNTVAVSLGRGDGTFAPKVLYACSAAPASLALADWNQDGHLDVAIACPGATRVQIRFGAGDGTLGAATDHVLTGPPVAIVAAQFNDQTDAFMDLLVVNSPTGSTLNNLRGLGLGAFSVAAYATPFRSVHIAAADVNHDGHSDLVFANAADSVAIFTGSGGGAFTGFQRYRVQGPPSSVAIVDVDQDGDPDVIAAIPGSNALNVMLGNGDGTFAAYASVPCGTAPRSVASADFNGDTRPDLAVTASGGSAVMILLGTGGGAFAPKVDHAAGAGTQGLAIATLDANATADLAVAASGQHSICTLPGLGDGTFQVPGGPVYVWSNTTTNASDANAWLPARSPATANDVLVINRGGVINGSLVPTQTIRQFIISGGSTVSLSASAGSATVTLTGGPGDDGVIEKDSKLLLITSSTIRLNAASGATTAVSGDVELRGSDNRLQALDVNGLVLRSGARAIIGVGVGLTPFGTGSGVTSGLNSVVFQNGSVCIAREFVNVFGAAAPAAVVVFQPGSRFRMEFGFNPPVTGRTYADFEYNIPGGNTTISGAGPLQWTA